jgi:exopolyphosphatase/guanosine-5'-triphosphate,3'-diphosphate pyrophosphatase
LSTRLIAPRGGAQHRPDQSPEKLSLTAVIYGCIDIGSNTTRLLVATGGARAQRCAPLTGSAREPLHQLVAERSFTRIGRSLDDDGRIPDDKIAETAAVAGAQARLAREMGARTVAAVATAAVRDAVNRGDLVAAVEDAAGVELRVLAGTEEARLSFLGATCTLPEPAQGIIAVVDVGGGSTEIAVGAPDGTVEWSQSVRVGSGVLTDTYLRSDPPAHAELDAVRERVHELFSTLVPPVATVAVAVGGSATSLHRLVGGDLDERTLAEGIAVLSSTRIEEVARRFELDAERVRLLPAGIIVLGAACGCLGLPLRIARGGLREGVILELMDGSRSAGA